MGLIELPYPTRNSHLYVPGKTRHGKSTLLMNLAYQDIRNGAGVCVLDPKGDLVKQLIHWIPEERVNDTICLDLKNPVPIDLLSYENDDEREALVGEIKYLVTQGEPMDHAPIMRAVLDDLVNTLLNYNENVPAAQRATFLDICNFLENEDRRKQILKRVSNPRWITKWKKMPNERSTLSVLTRLTPIVNSKSLRTVFGCPDPKLKVQDIMDNRKILLVDLGGITEPKKILGTLLIAKIRQTIFRREGTAPSKRIPFFLFVDEFEYFQTSDFDEILSFAGGYGLCLTLANQFLSQMQDHIRDALFGNVDNYIVFKLGNPKDAAYFKPLLASYEDPAMLHNLPKYSAWYKLSGQRPIVKPAPEPLGHSNASFAETIRKRTSANYACENVATCTSTKPDDDHLSKPDDISAGKAPHVPPHGGKKKNPRTSS